MYFCGVLSRQLLSACSIVNKMGIKQKRAIISVVVGALALIAVPMSTLAATEPGVVGDHDGGQLFPIRKSLEIHSPELQQIADDLRLTNKGQEVIDSVDDVYLYYRQASVQTACGFTDENAPGGIIEGCYSVDDADIWFIDSNGDGAWNIDEPVEITGDLMIVFDHDSVADTMAHEFLHAVYIRLSDDKRSELNELLYTAYKSNQVEMDRALRPYGFGQINTGDFIAMNELHSFIGTRIAELPDSLENHYALYFDDRSIVVALSNGQELLPHADNGHEPDIQPQQPGDSGNKPTTEPVQQSENSSWTRVDFDPDPITDKRGYAYFTPAIEVNSRSGFLSDAQHSIPDLYMLCDDSTTLGIGVDWGGQVFITFGDNPLSGTVRFDDEQPTTRLWELSDDYESTYHPAANSFVSEIMNHDKVVIRVNDGDNSATATFNIIGLEKCS